MFFLTLKKYTKKTLALMIRYWKILLILLMSVVSFVLFRRSGRPITEALEENHEKYKEQTKKIEIIHAKQIMQRNNNVVETEREKEVIEVDHKKKLVSLEEREEEIVREMKDSDLAEEMNKEFGL